MVRRPVSMSSVSGFLTGRCLVSKAKSDKVSPDLDTPTDLPQEAVDKISAALSTLQTIKDNNEDYVPPRQMLRELMEDNKHVAAAMRKAHKIADDNEDRGTAQLLELFIDETERRTWFLFEASRQEGSNAA